MKPSDKKQEQQNNKYRLKQNNKNGYIYITTTAIYII